MLRRLQLPRGRGVVAAQLIKMAKFKPVTFTTELAEGQPVEVWMVLVSSRIRIIVSGKYQCFFIQSKISNVTKSAVLNTVTPSGYGFWRTIQVVRMNLGFI